MWQTLSQLDRGVNCHRSGAGPWVYEALLVQGGHEVAQFLASRRENCLKWVETLELSCYSYREDVLHQTLGVKLGPGRGQSGLSSEIWDLPAPGTAQRGSLVTFKGGDYQQSGRAGLWTPEYLSQLEVLITPFVPVQVWWQIFFRWRVSTMAAPGRQGRLRDEVVTPGRGRREKHSPDRIFGVSNL